MSYTDAPVFEGGPGLGIDPNGSDLPQGESAAVEEEEMDGLSIIIRREDNTDAVPSTNADELLALFADYDPDGHQDPASAEVSLVSANSPASASDPVIKTEDVQNTMEPVKLEPIIIDFHRVKDEHEQDIPTSSHTPRIVGAQVNIARIPHLIYTFNASYIPLPPSPDDLRIRRDFRLGAEDPMLWPQYFDPRPEYAYLAAVPSKPPFPDQQFDILWAPLEARHCVTADPRGRIGDERLKEITRFYRSLQINSQVMLAPTLANLCHIYDILVEGLSQMQNTHILRLGWCHIQRTLLEIIAYIEYNTSSGRLNGERIGAFTGNLKDAARLADRGIPVWIYVPLEQADVKMGHTTLPERPEQRSIRVDFDSQAPVFDIKPSNTADIIDAIHRQCLHNFASNHAAKRAKTEPSKPVYSYLYVFAVLTHIFVDDDDYNSYKRKRLR